MIFLPAEEVGRMKKGRIFMSKKLSNERWKVSVAISDGHQKMVLIRNGEEKEVIYVYRMLGFVAYTDDDGNEYRSRLLYKDGVTAVYLDGSPITGFEFSSGLFETLKVFIDNQQLKSEAILRLGFFAVTDAGTILVSVYPRIKHMARPFVMFFSNKCNKVAMAQHISASWMSEMFLKK